MKRLIFTFAGLLAACTLAHAQNTGQAVATGQSGTAGQTGTASGQAAATGQGAAQATGQAGTTEQPGQFNAGQNAAAQAGFGQPNDSPENFNQPVNNRLPEGGQFGATGQTGVGMNPAWFNSPNVQREIGLTNEQAQRLYNSYGATWEQFRGADSNADANSNVNSNLQNEVPSRRSNLSSDRFDDAFSRNIDDIFSTPEQRQRFNELSLQQQGLSAFDNPAFQRQMNLNDTQRRQLQELNQNWDAEIQGLRDLYATDPALANQRYQQFREQMQMRRNGILNEQQRMSYEQQMGRPFDFGLDTVLGRQRALQESSGINAGDVNREPSPGFNTGRSPGFNTGGSNAGETAVGARGDVGNNGAATGTNSDLGTNSNTPPGVNANANAGADGFGFGVGTGSGNPGAAAGAGTGTGAGTNNTGSGTASGTTDTSGSGSSSNTSGSGSGSGTSGSGSGS